MIVMKCPSCGKKVVWDDFQPVDIRCPNCGETLNVHSSLRKNLELRELGQGKTIRYCPHCKGIVTRRWFIRCPHCRYWLFGPAYFHGNWPFILGLALVYSIVTLYYVLCVH